MTGEQPVQNQGSRKENNVLNDWTPADSYPGSISPIAPNQFSGAPLLFYIQLSVLGRNDSSTSSRSGP